MENFTRMLVECNLSSVGEMLFIRSQCKDLLYSSGNNAHYVLCSVLIGAVM